MLAASIFNDVLGPIMRGPSSSHSAASVRIARLARELAGGCLQEVLIEFDSNGSLATTHESQGSDLGLFGGLLGWEPDDPRLPDGRETLEQQGVRVEIRIGDIGATHPNTYRLSVTGSAGKHVLVADSLGGGMIVVKEIDGQPMQLHGDYRVTLINGLDDHDVEQLKKDQPALIDIQLGSRWCVVQGPDFVDDAWCQARSLSAVRKLDRVLPVPSLPNMQLPFSSTEEMVQLVDPTTVPLSEFALRYETARSGWSEAKVLEMMNRIAGIMQVSIETGLAGTTYHDRILGNQSAGFRAAQSAGRLLEGGMVNRMILYVTALMEAKSAMEVIVAAPTAGSCGTFPGTCLAAAEEMNLDRDVCLRAMLGGGLIGVLVATRSSFAAEVGGCQAETGAGSAMAAASLVEMLGGNAAQSLHAASMALQNVLGLVCDPVANRVEAPCLGRNVSGATNAFASANMALAGFDSLIPFDQVLDAHRQISQSMPRELRCTALGGLSITPASKLIELRLHGARTATSSGCGCSPGSAACGSRPADS